MTDERVNELPLVNVVPPATLPPDEPYRLVTHPAFAALISEGTPMTTDLAQLLNDLEQRRRDVDPPETPR
ncbi:hypothetical protein P3102_22475 [Amycolatopsis sp. QT-25]|uniref:hypothetical protein n=1 Tax=Amycolatopsis sp. QT-25 TaxID=3034022 RepID=UPI0023ECDA12|nr:hypothetical protein [Amycolatopsis sp. QT-25]WET76872.1 hypothetical protein P3102_22475 [Amycolatopsis sp. QT-25]